MIWEKKESFWEKVITLIAESILWEKKYIWEKNFSHQ